MSLVRRAARLAGFVSVVVLAACAHSPSPSSADIKQAAALNARLSIEYLKLGKLADARDFVERALKQDPDNANVQQTAGLVYERLNEMGKAERAYSSAARLGRGDPNVQNSYAGFLCRTGKTAAGEKLFVQVARDPLYQTPEVALVNAGVCAHGAGDLVDAERYFNQALAIRPNQPEAMLQLANMALERGDAAAARATIQRDLAVNPASAELLWIAIKVERKLGDDVSAANYARRIEVEFPDSEQARMLRAGVAR